MSGPDEAKVVEAWAGEYYYDTVTRARHLTYSGPAASAGRGLPAVVGPVTIRHNGITFTVPGDHNEADVTRTFHRLRRRDETHRARCGAVDDLQAQLDKARAEVTRLEGELAAKDSSRGYVNAATANLARAWTADSDLYNLVFEKAREGDVFARGVGWKGTLADSFVGGLLYGACRNMPSLATLKVKACDVDWLEVACILRDDVAAEKRRGN